MTVEWNTRRMMVMSKSTKGKNDRMALAATEKANVCTSVRNKYFTVDSTSPKRELCAGQVAGADLAGAERRRRFSILFPCYQIVAGLLLSITAILRREPHRGCASAS